VPQPLRHKQRAPLTSKAIIMFEANHPMMQHRIQKDQNTQAVFIFGLWHCVIISEVGNILEESAIFIFHTGDGVFMDVIYNN
jgi:hypothetical protein